ncbi:uncharacterized protein TNCV_1797061 [Trichonephila clavipes]|nr:uncharacterized protein TNCV_1797061 [Trichonephila clavipes]
MNLVETQSSEEMQKNAVEHFRKTVHRNEKGRYIAPCPNEIRGSRSCTADQVRLATKEKEEDFAKEMTVMRLISEFWYDAARPVQDVLQNRLILQLEEWFPNGKSYIFMQDGAPCHTARSIKAFLAEQNIPLLDWAGNSSDMNPIENIWELMKREVAKDLITNKTQLLERIIYVWNHHPEMQETEQSCVDSMPRRIGALIAAKGGSTK